MIELTLSVGFLVLAYFVGSRREKEHVRSLLEREAQVREIPLVTGKRFIDSSRQIARVEFVTGQVAIAQDSFKAFVGSLVNLFGGNVKVLESLLDRARREAILRMIADAGKPDLILNVRLETSTIAATESTKGSSGNAEILAYGTAIYYR